MFLMVINSQPQYYYMNPKQLINGSNTDIIKNMIVYDCNSMLLSMITFHHPLSGQFLYLSISDSLIDLFYLPFCSILESLHLRLARR